MVTGLWLRRRAIAIFTVLGVTAAIASVVIALYQTDLQRRQMSLGVDTKVSVELFFPELAEDLRPVLRVRNESTIPVVTVSADYFLLAFRKRDLKLCWASSALSGESVLLRHSLFRNRLEPNEYQESRLGDVVTPDPHGRHGVIWIYVVFESHFRESDRQRFQAREIFALDEGKPVLKSKLQASDWFPKMREVLDRVVPPHFGESFVEKHEPASRRLAPPINFRMVHSNEYCMLDEEQETPESVSSPVARQ